MFVFAEILVHYLGVHETEWPVHAIFIFSSLHKPVKLPKVTFISKVESEGHGWVATSQVNFPSLHAVVSQPVLIIDFNFWELGTFWSLILLVLNGLKSGHILCELSLN